MAFADKMKAICDKIRDYTGGTAPLTLDGIASGVDEVHGIAFAHGQDSGYENGYTDGYGEGEKSQYDYFWDTFQENGERENYIACFGSGWTPELFKPKYQIKPISANNMAVNNNGEYLTIPDFVEFANALAEEQGKTIESNPDLFDANGNYNLIDFSRCLNCYYALAAIHSPHFGTLDFSSCLNMQWVFYSHMYGIPVTTIDNIISSATTAFNANTFQHATYLSSIRMSGVVAKSISFGTCPLDKESVQSVVDVLDRSVTGQTVTFKASSRALFTDDEWATLIADIDNWTIAV